MSKRSALSVAFAAVVIGFGDSLYAQDLSANATEVAKWSIITGGFALAIAAAFGALAQARGLSSAAEGIARNPSAAGEIRQAMILGLVLIESLVIYVLLIAFIVLLVNPFI